MAYNKEIKLVTLSGPAGAGKTTMMEMFLAFPRSFKVIESYTTRPKRAEEKDAGSKSEYVFISEKDFEQLVQKESFAWYVTYDGHYYGTLKKSLKEALDAKHISVMILTPETVADLREQIKMLGGNPRENIVSFFIWAPEDDLRLRMAWRGDNRISIKERLSLVSYQNKKSKELDLIRIKNSNKERPPEVFQKMHEYLLSSPQA